VNDDPGQPAGAEWHNQAASRLYAVMERLGQRIRERLIQRNGQRNVCKLRHRL
jgi:hypothetical protein